MIFSNFNNDIFGKFTIAIDENGMAWFRAKEITDILELDRSAIRRVDEEDRRHETITTAQGSREAIFINEAGMYMLVLASKKAEAKAFQRWITHVVLPAIRKNGGYIAGQENLSEDDRKVLEKEIESLRARVQFAEAGKVKLSEYLKAEEDRGFELIR